MNQKQIEEVNSHKHLGVVFTDDCTWHDHLNYIKCKAWNRINVMRKLKFKLDRRSLQIIYFTFIRPLLEYADVVWDNCSQYEVNELKKIQNEAARIVTGATKLVSINRPFSHCFCACVYRSRDALFLDNPRDFTEMGQTDFKPLIFSM